MRMQEKGGRCVGRLFATVLVGILFLLGFRNVTSACHLESAEPCPLEKNFAYFLEGTELLRGGYLPLSVEKKRYVAALICPDIASTDLFGSGELEYIHTIEFAEAVYNVATGNSRYSPREIPAEWLTTAYAWGAHLAASNTMPTLTVAGPAPAERTLPEGRDGCSPLLLFRASLEYRSASGHEEIQLAYPYRIRAASKRLLEEIAGTTALAAAQSPTATSMQGTEGTTGSSGAEVRYRESIESAIRWISEHGESTTR